MSTLKVHTMDSAPEGSKEILNQTQQSLGFVPNLFGVFSESPAVLKSYLALSENFEKESAFDATERQVVLITISFENECTYCVAAHSVISSMTGVSQEVVTALRDNTPLDNPKLEALRSFTRSVVSHRGFVPEDDLNAFLQAGYESRHVLEVILGAALKTISNFTNHVAETPLDPAFSPAEWSKPVNSES